MSDAAYMDAVSRGDMATAQRMVDAAAKKAGYSTKGFHRTPFKFTKFIPGGPKAEAQIWRTKSGEARTLFGQSGRAMWFGSTPENLPAYHNEPTGKGAVLKVYLKNPSPLQIDDDTRAWARDVYADGSKEFPLLLSDEHIKSIKSDGYSGIEYWESGKTAEKSKPDEIVVFDPSQIKSADPVTYDDAGNVIPLSQRFDASTEDIRNPRHSSKGDGKGININDMDQDFTGQILRGEKTIETRPSRSLDSRIGKRTGIIRTGVGPATLVGYAVIGEPVVYDSVAKFRKDYPKHLVAPGSTHDIKGGLKYGYPLMQVEAVTPRVIKSRGIVVRKLNPYTKPDLRERLKDKIMAGSRGGRPGEWSARKAQLLASEYEKAGGGYTGARSKAQKNLSKWTKQDWRTKSGKPSLETGERYLPAAAIAALTSAEYAATSRAKRSASGQFSRQPKRIAMKTKEFRNPLTYQPDEITQAALGKGPASQDINASKALWETPAFKKWFGDSKVRDLAKRPMVVYHGTCSSGFTKFDPTKTREMGFHFGTQAQAKDFLKGCGTYRGSKPGIYPVYLSIQNPLFTPDVYSESPTFFIEWLENTNHIHEWFPDEDDAYYKSLNKLRGQLAEANLLTGEGSHRYRQRLYKTIWGLLRKIVMRKGYDGIRYKNENEGQTELSINIAWIAFSPAQVKSATESRGTFNRRDPDLRNPRRSMIRSKLSRIIEPGDRILDYDRAQGEDLYRLWDLVHTDMPLNSEALTEIEGLLDDDGVLVIQSGEEPSGLRDHFRRATRYNGMLLVQGPMNPEEARINTEKLRRDLE